MVSACWTAAWSGACRNLFSSKRQTVIIDVGGQVFSTSREVLLRSPQDSVLWKMMQSEPYSDGRYFLDRDGRHFDVVLSYLKDGPEGVVLPEEEAALREVRREAEFLGLGELAQLIEDGNYCGAAEPNNEQERINAFNRVASQYGPKFFEDETQFDTITQLAATVLDAPIVFVSLIGSNMQYIKSAVGLEAKVTMRKHAFSGFCFTQEPSEAALTVFQNTAADARTARHPWVACSSQPIMFCGQCPLLTEDGYYLGALCVLDTVSRSFTRVQAQVLANLGSLVSGMLQRPPSSVKAPHDLVAMVRVEEESSKWPVLYASSLWGAVTGSEVTPPCLFTKSTPRWCRSPTASRQMEEDQACLFDHLTLDRGHALSLEKIRRSCSWEGRSATHVKGQLERTPVDVMFVPADQPLNVPNVPDVTIQPKGYMSDMVVGGATCQLYFVLMKPIFGHWNFQGQHYEAQALPRLRPQHCTGPARLPALPILARSEREDFSSDDLPMLADGCGGPVAHERVSLLGRNYLIEEKSVPKKGLHKTDTPWLHLESNLLQQQTKSEGGIAARTTARFLARSLCVKGARSNPL
eukprot:TRINITY_DN91552_c0_g1_i1.p1 TRINITY_DN91552_c0_g1~~TRINITY_DN91552_c0_g1_i1.p1  ORF type:complete len:579 (+),score=79.49 TRINITY_DN91552_c0_g1_i1:181-1917(+)